MNPRKKKLRFSGGTGVRSHMAHCVGFKVAALIALMTAVAAITRANCEYIWPVRPDAANLPPDRSRAFEPRGGEVVDVVGPICESGDYLAKARPLPQTKRGDLLAVFTAGAYGFAMSSNYNNRPRAPEVLVDGDQYRVIRRRETYEDLVALERV